MLSRIGHLLLILALLAAADGHLAALQSVAWAKMFADNARIDSFSQALEKTFDGKHPCRLCKCIARARQQEKKSTVQFEIKKLEFLRETVAFVIVSPNHFFFLDDRQDNFSSLIQSPPVPPPRQFPA
ncbi:MAG TPA: hypothetical protein VFB72_06200 [Verrucomicrobiae bacterium]|nr:hypothetical protein [Verrucomicrobiae bacterium]